MALKEFVGGSGTKQDFQPTPIRGSAYEKRGGQNSIQTPFLSQDFFFWGGGGEWEMLGKNAMQPDLFNLTDCSTHRVNLFSARLIF